MQCGAPLKTQCLWVTHLPPLLGPPGVLAVPQRIPVLLVWPHSQRYITVPCLLEDIAGGRGPALLCLRPLTAAAMYLQAQCAPEKFVNLLLAVFVWNYQNDLAFISDSFFNE